MTLYRETPCEHGKTNPHALPAHQAVGGIDSTCLGDGSREEVNREPIPWCTTHDREAVEYEHTEGMYDECWLAIWTSHNKGVCRISVGGPDHKWWKDT